VVNRDQLQRVLGDLGRTVGLVSLALDENDSCALLFDETIRVDLDYDDAGERLVLSARLGPPPAGDARELQAVLLRMNGFWRELDLSMALDPASGEVMQLRQVPVAGLDLTRLQNTLAAFVVAAENNVRLVRLGDGTAAAKAEPAPTPRGLADFAIRV
jgi:hypothetical protein